MPSLKIRGRQAATTLEPATAGAPVPSGSATQEERVLTFGDVFGRDAGGLIVLLVLFGALTLGSDEFLTGDNMANLARQVAVFGIIAVGQLLVILTAGIDLSVGSVLGLTGCITAELLVHGVGIVPAILVGMAAGAAIGVFNGSLVAYGKLPPFIVTLGMLGIARGVVLVLTDASTVQPLPESFGNIANGSFLGLPNLLWMFAAVVLVAAFVLRRTVFGRYVYAVGSNPESARLAGVPVTRVLVSVYAIAGLLAAVGGVLFTSRLNAGIPTAGTGLRAQRDRGVRHRRGEPVRRQGRGVRRRGRRAHRRHPQQRRQPLGHQLVLPADHHRRAHPRRGRLRPVAGPAVPRRMSVRRERGPPGRPGRPRRRRRPHRRLLRRAAGPGGGGAARRLRHLRAPRDLDGTDVQRGPRAGHRRGGVPLPRANRASTDRSSWGATRTRSPSRRRRPSSRCSAPTASRSWSTPTTASRRRPPSRTRSSPTTAAAADGTADGIVVTPSHNPPQDGGVKYNPPHGGPADTDVTGWIQREANALLEGGLRDVKRTQDAQRRRAATTTCRPTSTTCPPSSTSPSIRDSGLRLGVDPLGGASVAYWAAIAERHGLDLTITNDQVDPTFRFVPLDWDGKIRMDCSSPYAMAKLRDLADQFDVAFANDPDADRHGIVTPGRRPAEPQPPPRGVHRLPLRRQPRLAARTRRSARRSSRARSSTASPPTSGGAWSRCPSASSGSSTACSTARSASAARRARAPPSCAATATPWSTDKDGLIPCLLAAEMTARGGGDPGERYAAMAERFGRPVLPARRRGRRRPSRRRCSPSSPSDQVTGTELAGEPIREVLTEAPGNGAPIGGVKVVSESAWFAARPSGTEDVYKVYAESFLGDEHLERVIAEAEELVAGALGGTRCLTSSGSCWPAARASAWRR